MGIETDRPPAIDARMIAGIGTDNAIQAPPAITDFMKAFRDGFITVDDLQKRSRDEVNRNSDTKLNLQANDFKSRRLDDAATLAPGALSNASAQQALEARVIAAHGDDLDIANSTLPGREAVAAAANQDAVEGSNPDTRKDFLNRKRKEAAEAAYAEHVGPLPDSVDLQKPAKPEDYHDWYEKTIPKQVLTEANTFKSGFPLNSPEDNTARAEFINSREASLQSKAPALYQDYVRQQATQTAKAVRGTPEYDRAIQTELTKKLQDAAIQGAQLKALPVVLENQAKEGVTAPGEVTKAASEIRKEMQGNQVLKPLAEAKAYLRNAQSVFAKPEKDITNADDQVLVESFVKLLDPAGVIRQSKLAYVKEMTPFLQRMEKKISQAYSNQGGILTTSDRAQIKGAIDLVSESFDKAAKDELSTYGKAATRAGVPLTEIFTPAQLNVFNGVSSSPTAATTTAPPSAGAARVVQNGTTFQWNGTKYVPVAP